MKNIIILTIGVLGTLFTGCKPDEPEVIPPTPTETSEINIVIDHKFGDTDLDFGSEFTLPSNEVVVFRRFAYILSDFYLIKMDGSKHLLDSQYAYIDAKKNSAFKLLEIPMGSYTGLGFSVGLDSVTNHGDVNSYPVDHPLSEVNNSLHWDWSNGYIFTAIEGKTIDKNESFLFHLAGFKNKTNFEFPIEYTKGTSGLNATFQYDVTEVFKNPDIYSIETDGSSTHSISSPVTIKLFNNMKDVFSVVSVEE